MLALELGPAQLRFTERADGDMGHGGSYVASVAPLVDARRRAVVDLRYHDETGPLDELDMRDDELVEEEFDVPSFINRP